MDIKLDHFSTVLQSWVELGVVVPERSQPFAALRAHLEEAGLALGHVEQGAHVDRRVRLVVQHEARPVVRVGHEPVELVVFHGRHLPEARNVRV